MMLVWGKAEVNTEFESDLKAEFAADFATVIEFELYFCRSQEHETSCCKLRCLPFARF